MEDSSGGYKRMDKKQLGAARVRSGVWSWFLQLRPSCEPMSRSQKQPTAMRKRKTIIP